jgi:general secretion pathway protein M
MIGARRPLLALALLGLAVVLAGLAIYMPMMWAQRLHRDIEAKQLKLATITQALDSGRGLSEALAPGWLLGGSSTGRAAAELQQTMNAAAKAHNVSLRSIQVLAPKRDGELTQISVEVNFQTGATALRDLLHSLETGVPILILDDINIRAIPQQQAGQSGRETSGREMQLDASMKIRGFASLKDAP